MGNMKDIGLLDCEDRPSIEENFKRVQTGGGGGGGDILDSNGKLKSEVLPDGYPYKKVEELTVEHIPHPEEDYYESYLEGFSAFAAGDTVKLKVDGVEHSLVALDGDDYAYIGDDLKSVFEGTGEYGWHMYYDGYEGYFVSSEHHTVSWEYVEIDLMAEEFLPPMPKIIQLFIGGEYDPKEVYASYEDYLVLKAMTKNEFLDLVPYAVNGEELPYVVVLCSGYDRYTPISQIDDGENVTFYVFDNNSAVTGYSTGDEGGGVS